MPANLYIRSTVVLSLLWGIVFALVSTVFYFTQDNFSAGTSLTLAVLIAFVIVFIQFLISPFLMDLILGWVYDLSWIDYRDLPDDMAQALNSSMNRHHFSLKKVGIIHDQMPNAFTYGHFKGNARIVLTEGILDMLDSDERVAVLEHEVGHIVHRDFIFMTIAQVVPLAFYLIYITSRSFATTVGRTTGGKEEGGVAAASGLVMVVSYLFYLISGFMVLFLSRARESYADYFSAVETNHPNAMSTALVKVGYGLVVADTRNRNRAKDENLSRSERRRASRQNGMMYGLRSMGLADVRTAKGLVMQAYGEGQTEIHPDAIAAAAAWDLNSPWAKFIELNSTHPLIGKRLRHLDELAPTLGSEPKYPKLGQIKPPESLWDEFFVDLIVYYLFPILIILIPVIGGFYAQSEGFGFTAGVGAGLLVMTVLWYFRIHIRYPEIESYEDPQRPKNTVFEALSSMEKDMYYEASPVRGKPIKLVGHVIGRGTPGYYFGEDFVVQDESGFVIIDFSSLLGWLGNLIFGARKIERMIGQEVTVIGWYRRSTRPIVQLHRAYTQDGQVIKNHWLKANIFFMRFLAILGIIFLVIL